MDENFGIRALRDGNLLADDHPGGYVLYEKREQVEEYPCISHCLSGRKCYNNLRVSVLCRSAWADVRVLFVSSSG